MRLTLAITTHARADALAQVLASAVAQDRQADEILVVEDGCDGATAEVVARRAAALAATGGPPLRHLRQPHEGFRVARLRNLAIAAARGDHLVFVDGDMLLHHGFIADHRRVARPGFWTQGVRVPLDAAATAALLAAPAPPPASVALPAGPFASGRFGLRRAWLWHAPPLQRGLRRIGAAALAVKSCNQGFWRDDLLRVNGYDERFEGWGPEDKELCARLGHAGVQRQALLFGGIACHLHHPPAARDRKAFNDSLLAATRATRALRCERGVDGHLTA